MAKRIQPSSESDESVADEVQSEAKHSRIDVDQTDDVHVYLEGGVYLTRLIWDRVSINSCNMFQAISRWQDNTERSPLQDQEHLHQEHQEHRVTLPQMAFPLESDLFKLAHVVRRLSVGAEDFDRLYQQETDSHTSYLARCVAEYWQIPITRKAVRFDKEEDFVFDFFNGGARDLIFNGPLTPNQIFNIVKQLPAVRQVIEGWLVEDCWTGVGRPPWIATFRQNIDVSFDLGERFSRLLPGNPTVDIFRDGHLGLLMIGACVVDFYHDVAATIYEFKVDGQLYVFERVVKLFEKLQGLQWVASCDQFVVFIFHDQREIRLSRENDAMVLATFNGRVLRAVQSMLNESEKEFTYRRRCPIRGNFWGQDCFTIYRPLCDVPNVIQYYDQELSSLHGGDQFCLRRYQDKVHCCNVSEEMTVPIFKVSRSFVEHICVCNDQQSSSLFKANVSAFQPLMNLCRQLASVLPITTCHMPFFQQQRPFQGIQFAPHTLEDEPLQEWALIMSHVGITEADWRSGRLRNIFFTMNFQYDDETLNIMLNIHPKTLQSV